MKSGSNYSKPAGVKAPGRVSWGWLSGGTLWKEPSSPRTVQASAAQPGGGGAAGRAGKRAAWRGAGSDPLPAPSSRCPWPCCICCPKSACWAAALQADGRPFSTGTWGSPLDPHALNKGGHLGGLLVYSHPRRNGAGAWPGSSWGSRGQRAPACCLLPWRGRAALRGAMLSSPLSRCAALLSRSGTGQQEQRAQGNR